MPCPNTSHALVFPLPLQGAIKSMLKFAELLCMSNINVTFLLVEHHYNRILPNTKGQSSPFEKYPGFRLESIADCLPPDHHCSGSKYIEWFDSITRHNKPILKEMSISGKYVTDGCGPSTCLIADGLMSFVCDVANQVGIPYISTRTLSASSLSIFFSLPQLIESGELPFTGDDLAKKCLSEGGSLHSNLERLIENIKLTGVPNKEPDSNAERVCKTN